MVAIIAASTTRTKDAILQISEIGAALRFRYGAVYNTYNVQRHLVGRSTRRNVRTAARMTPNGGTPDHMREAEEKIRAGNGAAAERDHRSS
jgi:hypothetical protein